MRVAAEPGQDAAEPPPASVLVIDDSAVQRAHTVELCRSIGIATVREAANGQEALALLESFTPRLLILDLEMPTMDGPQLLSRLRSRGIAIPVVLASSRDVAIMHSVQHLGKALGVPILGGLQKPIDEAGLLRTLRVGVAPPARDLGAPRAVVDEASLRHAIESGQLITHYQPQVELATGRVRGVEALVRWAHPQAGMIMPDQFIALAEQWDLIHALTLRVLNDALLHLVQWRNAGLDFTVAVNLSPLLLRRSDLVDEIVALTQVYELPPDRLVLEITESSLVEMAHALEILTRLRLRGYRLSLDDYGSGYSSMKQLAQIPFTELKIDRSLVQGVAVRQNLQVMLRSAVAMARDLGLVTVAEGVESSEDLKFLSECGCAMAQGWHFSRALAPNDLGKWVQERGS